MYFQPEDNRETITAKRGKVLRNYRFKHELKMTFLLIFTRNRGGLKRQGENGGARSHTWQFQEKI